MNVIVTQACIDHGVPGRAKRCPVALALRHAYKGSWMVISDAHGSKGNIVLGEEVRRFVKRFDNGFSVQPFSFSAVLRPYPKKVR